MAEVAAKLPVEVISHMVGLPPEISSQLRKLSEGAWKDRFGEPGTTPRKMGELMMGEAMDRLADPRDDFLTALVQTQIDGRPIDPFEVVSFLLGAAIAGHETTMNAAGNVCYELATDQDLQARVRADRSLIPALVEESLRLRAPVQNFFRVVTRDHELHGQPLRTGERVMLIYGAANHDADAFADPDQLSLERGANRHLSFGWGVHRCPGAHLAQVELATSPIGWSTGRRSLRPARWCSDTWRAVAPSSASAPCRSSSRSDARKAPGGARSWTSRQAL